MSFSGFNHQSSNSCWTTKCILKIWYENCIFKVQKVRIFAYPNWTLSNTLVLRLWNTRLCIVLSVWSWVQNHDKNRTHCRVQNWTGPRGFSHDFEPLYKYFCVRFYKFIRSRHFAIDNPSSPFKCAQSFLGFNLVQDTFDNILILPFPAHILSKMESFILFAKSNRNSVGDKTSVDNWTG